MNNDYVLDKLKTYDGSAFDLCYEICEYIDALPLEDQIPFVQTLCQNYGFISSDKTYEILPKVSKEDVAILRDNYGKYINESIAVSLKKGYNYKWVEDEFYRALWKSICNSEIVTTLIEKSFALYYIAIDRRIPYFQLDNGVEMDNEMFRKILKDNEEPIKKIKFIIYSEFNQKTEKASLLLDEILEAESAEDQIIRMVSIINAFQEEKRRLNRVIKQISEQE